MHAIPIQRLLTHEVNHARVSFFFGDAQQETPAILIFSPAWAMPLVAAYAKGIAVQALGRDALALVQERRTQSEDAPLGYISHLAAVDGTAQGLLRAAVVTRAAQEALGYSLMSAQPQRVNWLSVVAQATSQQDSLSYRLLHCQSDDELIDLVREAGEIARGDLPVSTADEHLRALSR